MAGTKAGGQAAAETNKKKYGEDYYAVIGILGGKNGHTGGFASDKVDTQGMTGNERARIFGSVGGKTSHHVWTEEEKEKHGELMREIARRKHEQQSNI